MNKRKPKPTAKQLPRHQKTRASSKLQARTVAADDDDEDDEDELASDEALALFLKRPPLGADRFTVIALSASGDQTVQDRPAAECKRAYVQVANSTVSACERWANAEGREVRFRAAWQQGDRVLATHQWRAGQGDPRALDGTVESFLAQQQRHTENKEQLYTEAFTLLQDGWKTLLGAQNRRIEGLEKDNGELRDRLRKVDDVGTEIALEQARADLEARGRTADILEQRVLPVVQALVVQQAQKAMASAADGGGAKSEATPPPAGNRKEN